MSFACLFSFLFCLCVVKKRYLMMNTLVSFVWYYSIESIDQLHQIEAPQKIFPDKLRFISEMSFRIQRNF